MKRWTHSRKGTITGTVVREDDTWMWVRLSGDHTLRYAAQGNRGRVEEDGDVMCLRKSLMKELELTEGEMTMSRGLDYDIDGRPMSAGSALLEALRTDPSLAHDASANDDEHGDD
ncbi:hypothetical protein [Mycolicibacterium fortuitum]|uniref:Uncharacterized protein n=2 Tax=Mycolicibacterium fortuitum TaxID=1766 RepID=A0AAE5AF00_MYCFO|nr:hypothetical protein [Mycolicibacterium fortuitum]MCV7138370.1 hypothetical protein [Mycolicibacterium fortuitum]MDV7193666.1 hypothetical protein [Mycolicibacterium fortuitum]MDV7207075.1 hypothetical protein [Mycolicibacterium fortuitum]MDV7228586.1 hypothetical protein [Mycolicibacterium fortuitum]MDV7260650.1 hypothetical protein [Mycolicibacterium fortuitum]